MPTRLADLLRRFRRVVAPGAAGPPGEPTGAAPHDEALDRLLRRIAELDTAAEARVAEARKQAERIRHEGRDAAAELRAGAGAVALAEQARAEASGHDAREHEIAGVAAGAGAEVDAVAARSAELLDGTVEAVVALVRSWGDGVEPAGAEDHR